MAMNYLLFIKNCRGLWLLIGELHCYSLNLFRNVYLHKYKILNYICQIAELLQFLKMKSSRLYNA